MIIDFFSTSKPKAMMFGNDGKNGLQNTFKPAAYWVKVAGLASCYESSYGSILPCPGNQ